MANEPKQRLLIDDTAYETEFTPKYEARKPYQPANPKAVKAFIPGVIVKLHIRHGQKVSQGDHLLTLEAMKMQNEVLSPIDGTVKVILVREGQKTRKDQLLLEFE